MNYLYRDQLGIVTQERLARQLGFEACDAGSRGGPGNDELMDWFQQFLKGNRLAGSACVVLNGDSMPEVGTAAYERKVNKMKRASRDPESILVYHSENHYRPVCGYFESAKAPTEAFAKDPELHRWLLLADHNPDADPLQCIRLQEMRNVLDLWEGYGILLFSKLVL